MKCIRWNNGIIELIDQTLLPCRLQWIECRNVETLGDAIKRLAIRGAPALGISAGMGMALSARNSDSPTLEGMKEELERTRNFIAGTRPTAVNLFWALERMMRIIRPFHGEKDHLIRLLEQEALEIAVEDEEMCRKIGENGAEVVQDGWNIVHHCNTGFLATGEHGTALGVIRSAHQQGKRIHVYVDETRPLLQGARLTAWELKQDGIPFTLIADNMAGFLMKQGKINMAIVGADRIASNGDVANKIGSYSLAVLSKYHGVPFYSAAPFSTVDLSIESGEQIPIEERNSEELTYFQGVQSAPSDCRTYNPAFDVTPHELITGIITERGIIREPFDMKSCGKMED